MTPRKFCFAVAPLFLFCMLPVSLRADTVYTYTGDTYNSCGGGYSAGGIVCNKPYSLQITFDVKAGTPLDNLAISEGQLPGAKGFGNVTADVSSFSFADGSGLDFNASNSTYYAFNIATDATGHITAWSMDACGFSGVHSICELSYFFPSYPQIDDTTSYSDESSGGACFVFGPGALSGPCLGTWTESDTSSETPEPATVALLSTGLFGLAGAGQRKWRRLTRN